jgi:hypothetical protein
MGYPMSYQRVIHRSGLQTGGYGDLPVYLNRTVLEGGHTDAVTEDEAWLSRRPFIIESVKALEGRWSMLLGDLRRMETDTLDERATCEHIATRTGIDAEIVAAVLKDFMAW